MEGRALVAETMLAGGELAEVTSGLWDDVVVELEGDAPRGLVVDRDIELRVQSPEINNAGAQLHATRAPGRGWRTERQRKEAHDCSAERGRAAGGRKLTKTLDMATEVEEERRVCVSGHRGPALLWVGQEVADQRSSAPRSSRFDNLTAVTIGHNR